MAKKTTSEVTETFVAGDAGPEPEVVIVQEPTTVAGEDYSVINTTVTKEQLKEDGWVQETKEPFVDVDGKSKLLFHKKSFYKFLEVES